MNMPSRASVVSRLLTPLVVCLSLLRGPMAWAQEQLQRVEITGSNIKRVQAEQASPMLVINAQDLAASGQASVADYLQTLAQDGSGSLPTSFGDGHAGGATAISLRGLGANATLVLVNGYRLAAYPSADDGRKVFTDLSSIPMALVERIEIVKNGASAIYGSDAIAGVVNIILRKDFEGMVGAASAGVSGYGDLKQGRVSLSVGTGQLSRDGYNHVFDLEAFHSDKLQDAARAGRAWIGQGNLQPWGYPAATTWSEGLIGGTNSAGASPTGALRNPATLNYASLTGCAGFSVAQPQDPGGGCLWYDSQFRSMEPSIDTLNLSASGAWTLGPALQAYAELMYADNRSSFSLPPPSITPVVAFPANAANPNGVINYGNLILMSALHPQNPYGQAVRVAYSAFDVGPQQLNRDNQFVRLLGGLKGQADGWDWDVSLLHSQDRLDNTFTNYLNMAVVQAALGDPGSAYFPYYIGAQAGKNPAALYAAMVTDLRSTATTRLDQLAFKATRDLLALPGGPLSLAMGGEYAHESVDIPAMSGTQTGAVDFNYNAAQGADTVTALYAELLAPLGATLESSVAVRYDHYDSFASTTPQFNFKWTPMKSLALRAAYAEGFRAPNAAENSTSSQTTGTASVTDPVRCPGGTPAPGGATVADCSISISGVKIGNPALRPETSRSWSMGLVWDLPTATGLTLDFWNIKRSSEISPISFGAAAGLPTALRADNNLVANGQTVPSSGTLLVVFRPFINYSDTEVAGVDLDLKQRIALGEMGRATLSLNWSHLTRWQQVQPALPLSPGVTLAAGTSNYLGTHGNCDTSNCLGTPTDRFNLSARWERGDWMAAALVNYRGSLSNVYAVGGACASQFASGSPAPSGCALPAFYTLDVSARWQASRQLQLSASIQNLLDRVAPLDPLTYGAVSYNPMDVSGAIGRYFRVGLQYQFR